MLLKGSPVSTQGMDWNSIKRMLTCELSEISHAFHRVYDDACDVGFTLHSHITGQEIVFVQHSERRDSEGELMWIDYKPAPRQHALNIIVRAFND